MKLGRIPVQGPKRVKTWIADGLESIKVSRMDTFIVFFNFAKAIFKEGRHREDMELGGNKWKQDV